MKKKAYIYCEKEWMGGHKAWAIVDENMKALTGMYWRRKYAIERFENEYFGKVLADEYEIQKKPIKIDYYADMRRIEPEKGFELPKDKNWGTKAGTPTFS